MFMLYGLIYPLVRGKIMLLAEHQLCFTDQHVYEESRFASNTQLPQYLFSPLKLWLDTGALKEKDAFLSSV